MLIRSFASFACLVALEAQAQWTNPEYLARFEAPGDGTVVDRTTGLRWTARDNGYDLSHAEAEAWCSNLRLSGGGWNLPTRMQLLDLRDRSERQRAPCGASVCNVTTSFELSGPWFWTAERNADGYPFFGELTPAPSGGADPIGLRTGRALCVRSA